jgi:hypothetical protein
MDLSKEKPETLTLYGAEPGKSSFANNCLLARRLVERGVRFVQLYHTDWDHHGGVGADLGAPLEKVCREVDQPCAALIRDLKQRGLLRRDARVKERRKAGLKKARKRPQFSKR